MLPIVLQNLMLALVAVADAFMPVPASMKSANCPGCFTISGSISG